jgi:hypothetical protein
LVELDWSVLAMAVAELIALKEQFTKKAGRSRSKTKSINPLKRSLAQTMRAIRGSLANLRQPSEPGKDLATQLRNAVTDSYTRKASKKARYRPPNPDKKPLGDPKLRRLTAAEKQQMKRTESQKTE